MHPLVDYGEVLGSGGPDLGRLGGGEDGGQGAWSALRAHAVGQPPLHASGR